mmetsp:Transcript_12034/g.30340  ORF Transcript_12034/g.30340 Transcript_12034/m.30340 type:complete len:117 (-) Transcript_12034:453-803(-)
MVAAELKEVNPRDFQEMVGLIKSAAVVLAELMYPADPTAAINAAASQLQGDPVTTEKRYERAKRAICDYAATAPKASVERRVANVIMTEALMKGDRDADIATKGRKRAKEDAKELR